MKRAFADTLHAMMVDNKDIWLVTADMGFGLFDSIATVFPDRVINVGVAEQNAIGVASGLALSGKKVFVYSIANFPTMRCLEQIRNDVCYHNLDVTVVCGSSGLHYGVLGYTHHALEDVAAVRPLPNMKVVCPGNLIEAEVATRTARGPCYLRLGRPDDEETYPVWWDTPNVLVVATGSALRNSRLAVDKMRMAGMAVNLVGIVMLGHHFAIPPETKIVITVEEHSIIGGLGSLVAERIAGYRGGRIKLIRMGTKPPHPIVAMDYERLLEYYHLTVDDIVREAIDALAEAASDNEKVPA